MAEIPILIFSIGQNPMTRSTPLGRTLISGHPRPTPGGAIHKKLRRPLGEAPMANTPSGAARTHGPPTQTSKDTSPKCFRCGKLGHIKGDCENPPASREQQEQWRREEEAKWDQLRKEKNAARDAKAATRAAKDARLGRTPKPSLPAVEEEPFGTRTGKQRDKGKVLEDNFVQPPSSKMAKLHGKPATKGELGRESSFGVLTSSASGDETKRQLLEGYSGVVQRADEERSAKAREKAVARAEEEARTGIKYEPEPVRFVETYKQVGLGDGGERTVVEKTTSTVGLAADKEASGT